MWQSSNHRAQANKDEKRRRKERMELAIHFSRVPAELRMMPKLGKKGEPISARLILNDLNTTGMGFFASKAIPVGLDVGITIEHPQRIYIKGHVMWCQEIENANRIISEESYNFRVGIRFVINTEEEQKEIEEYCDQVVKEFLTAG